VRNSALRRGLDLLVHPVRAEASLWRRLRFEAQGECREALFDRYVPLARAIAAAKFGQRRGSAERGDCEHLAYEGLLQAIDRFDPLLGVPFSAYARRRIVGSIADGLAKMSEVGAQISHRRRVEQERMRSLAPSDAAAAEDPLAALSDLAIGLALGLMLEGTSMMAADGADTRPSAYESLEWREMQARLGEAVRKLPEKETLIVRQHYHNGLSLAQIAELLGLSRGRISQLHRSALERLRKRIGSI
jgi:RNA polymerase sigma factor for flagellar operon FliA